MHLMCHKILKFSSNCMGGNGSKDSKIHDTFTWSIGSSCSEY